jgi:hypothetical protein
VNFLKRWINSAIAYRRGGDMLLGGDNAGPGGTVPAMGAIEDHQILSIAEQDIDESNKVDPDPEIASGVK